MNASDRFKAAVQVVLDELIPNRRFYAPVRYTVVESSGNGKIDVIPERAKGGYPPLADVPVRGYAASNDGSKLRIGASVMIAFAEGDRSDPFLLDSLSPPLEYAIESGEKITIEAPAIEITGASTKVNGGVQPVARVGDTVMGILLITSGNPTFTA